MNDSTSWDPSLVKKFSTSNHYKLLNQLRNEVKKYPLNNKKKTVSIQSKDTNIDNKNNIKVQLTQNTISSNNSSRTSESNTHKSTVSFNNAKNFSIYNHTTSNNTNRHNEPFTTEQTKLNDDSSTPSFKERLDQIDMK
tara:strand:+ start:140 stop:553 length:414 start_codon:yes stop_codon:yes gene_type:complete